MPREDSNTVNILLIIKYLFNYHQEDPNLVPNRETRYWKLQFKSRNAREIIFQATYLGWKIELHFHLISCNDAPRRNHACICIAAALTPKTHPLTTIM